MGRGRPESEARVERFEALLRGDADRLPRKRAGRAGEPLDHQHAAEADAAITAPRQHPPDRGFGELLSRVDDPQVARENRLGAARTQPSRCHA